MWYWISATTLPNPNRFSNFSTVRKSIKFPPKCIQNSQHALIMLLHYLVKYSTHYYCTVHNVFRAVLNDQQMLLQFIDILNAQMVDMPIYDATRLRSRLFHLLMNSGVACSRNQCHGLCVGECCPTERKRTLPPINERSRIRQHICRLGTVGLANSVTKSIYWLSV